MYRRWRERGAGGRCGQQRGDRRGQCPRRGIRLHERPVDRHRTAVYSQSGLEHRADVLPVLFQSNHWRRLSITEVGGMVLVKPASQLHGHKCPLHADGRGSGGSGDYRLALNPVPAQAFATAEV